MRSRHNNRRADVERGDVVAPIRAAIGEGDRGDRRDGRRWDCRLGGLARNLPARGEGVARYPGKERSRMSARGPPSSVTPAGCSISI